jgi:penicillin-binding protein 1A
MGSTSRPSPNGAAKKTKKASSARKFLFTVIKFLVIFFVALGCALAGIAGGAIYGYVKTAEPIRDEQLETMISNKTTFIYDSRGNVIQKLTGKDNKDSEPITDKEVPKYLKDAIVAIEDERFYTHPGIDLKRILSAGFTFVTGKGSTHGGSTITQQVVKNITGNDQRSLQRKVQEWYIAIQLERKLEKWQILELYMNVSYWGHSCYGVQSASKKYFGKPVQELTLAQCALLAGITNRPGTYDPFTEQGRKNAKDRQEVILGQMLEFGMIGQTEYDTAMVEDLKYASQEQSKKVTSVQSYFVDQVIIDVRNALMKDYNMSSTMANYMIYNSGLEIHTTQDPSVQSAMDQVFNDDEYFPLINETAKRQLEHPQSAMVIIDAQNGQVKALYGGYGKKEASNTLNRASSSLMKRQPGSSIKPLVVYAPAIDLKLITPATIIDDVPVYMKSPLEKDSDKEYPRNYDNEHDGLTSVRNGLKNSVNVVAARIWKEILGADSSVDYLKRVGIDREKEKYLSLVMGGLETGVNPLQMAAAYVPFVHKGMYYEPTTFTLVKDSSGKTLIDKKPAYQAAYSEQTAFLMRDMMKGVTTGKENTYPHSGTAAAYVNEKIIGMPVAGKTGTTSSNIDKWFVGYTPYYTAAVWYGYDNNGSEPIALKKDEYNQAMKIWAAVMKKVHIDLPKKDFDPVPSGIVQKKICVYSGKVATALCEHDPRGNATRVEYFIKGTEPRDDDPCTLHVEASVCTESKDVYGRNLLAGPNCPLDKVVTQVFIQRGTPYMPTKPGEPAPKDIKYELPAGEYCTVHGGTPAVNSSITTNTALPGVGGNATGSAIQTQP